MKNIITSILKILIIGILIFLGTWIYEEIADIGVVDEVQEFVSNITISSEVKKEGTQEVASVEIEDIIKTEKEENSNNYINKYFYNQIDDYSKKIYNEIYNNKENMKTGNYEINFENQFSKLLDQENGAEQLKECFQIAIESYTYDNPDVFYIDYSKLCFNIETTTRLNKKTYRVFINSGNANSYLNEYFYSKEKIDEALNEIEKVKTYFVQNKKIDTYENIKLVHDYLVDSIEYDETLSKDNIYNLYGAIVNKSCVCEGYAEAFKYLMDVLDIPCIIVIGDATNVQGNTESHAWNYIQLNENWYAIDCTWDDPIIEGLGFITNSQKHKYFLKGEKEFNKTHMPNAQFTEDGKIYTYPILNLSNY